MLAPKYGEGDHEYHIQNPKPCGRFMEPNETIQYSQYGNDNSMEVLMTFGKSSRKHAAPKHEAVSHQKIKYPDDCGLPN